MQKQINRIDIYINIAWLTLHVNTRSQHFIFSILEYISHFIFLKNVHFLSLLINVMTCVEIDQQIL